MNRQDMLITWVHFQLHFSEVLFTVVIHTSVTCIWMWPSFLYRWLFSLQWMLTSRLICSAGMGNFQMSKCHKPCLGVGELRSLLCHQAWKHYFLLNQKLLFYITMGVGSILPFLLLSVCSFEWLPILKKGSS